MLKINNLNLILNNTHILKNINLEVKKNKITAIIGKNASGKSSIIKCINGIYKYDGEILFEGKNINDIKIKEKSKKISILPQILKYPHILVSDLLLIGLNPSLSIYEKIKENDVIKINEIIKKFKIEHLQNKYLDELSGGQRQVVYLAMQLIQNAELMIFDEPSSFMDINYENQLLRVISDLKILNKTVLVVMHNINNIIKCADNIVIVDDGEVVFAGNKNECLEEKIIEKVFNLKRYEFEDHIIFENN